VTPAGVSGFFYIPGCLKKLFLPHFIRQRWQAILFHNCVGGLPQCLTLL
jgi:hypothetical protein